MRTLPGYTFSEVLLDDGDLVTVRAERSNEGRLLRFPSRERPAAEDAARLRYGAEVSRSLDLSGVLRVLGFEESERTLVAVLENFSGTPLKRLLASRSFTLAEALQIALQLTDTLGEIHRRHIVHLHVEPANIYVDTVSLATKLANFEGSAPLTGVVTASTRTLGATARYVSPEQTGRMNQALDHRSDFYSLGVTLYELLTGRVPFEETDQLALVHSHLAVEPAPPHTLSGSVPHAVSDLVMKLLAKNVEERYQSAFGLSADISECLRQLSEGAIGSVDLGKHDVPAIFTVPQRLYGREAEKAQLLAAFERVGRGNKVLCLVSGSSGVGKTALVREVHRPIVRLRGQFGAGKFDQAHSVPYGGLVRALRQVLGDILCTNEESIRLWRERLLTACGELGSVLAGVLPELELIIGAQPAVSSLAASETQVRFNNVFRQFVAALARADSPLVLFLDDLQWSDPAALEMMERLLCDEGLEHFYLIGGYRSSEVDAAHPLAALIKRVGSQGLSVNEIRLSPLEQHDVEAMMGDALGRGDTEALTRFAELVYKVTEGNPFFVGQFLTSLWARDLLLFDPVRGRWNWSLPAIQSSGVPESVGSLMATRIGKLESSTRQTLALAACVGHTFELETLAVLCERTLVDTADQLWQSVSEGLIVPLDDGYKYARAGSAPGGPVRLKFVHDRVQEAAYSFSLETSGGASHAAVHLRIGRLLFANTPAEERDARVFDIVDQLNWGASEISDAGERRMLSELNLRAGRRAKASAAPTAALAYFERGMGLLGHESGPNADPGLLFSLGRERAECAYLCGNHDLAEAEFKRLLEVSPSREVTAELQELRSNLYIARMNFAEATLALLDALRLYGVDLPGAGGLLAACGAERQAIEVLLSDRATARFDQLPDATDPDKIVRLHLLAKATSAAFGGDPLMFVLLASRLTRASLEHGCAPGSAWGFVAYGMVAAASGDYALAHELGVVALSISARQDSLSWRSIVGVTANIFNLPWRRPPRSSVPAQEEASLQAMAAGDPVYAAVAKWNILTLELAGGGELGKIDQLAAEYTSFCRRLNQGSTLALFAPTRFFLERLRRIDTPREPGTKSDFRALLDPLSGYVPGFSSCATFGLAVSVLLRDRETACELLPLAERGMGALLAHPSCVEFSLYRGLLSAWLHADATPEDRGKFRSAVQQEHEKLARWAELCPGNFRHKERLLAAEAARVDGADAEAMALYDEAIDSATNNGFAHMEALANELCGRFYVGRERHRTARAYLREARSAYARWGANAKLRALDREFAELLADAESMPPPHDRDSSPPSLDLLSVVKASQAISGEIVLSSLLERLMQTLVENAGAQRGIMIVSGEPELFASIDLTAQNGGVLRDSPGTFGYAQSVARRVQRTRETLVYDDARNDGGLSLDPYVVQARPRSLLCMPILARSKLVGVLYLENNVARAVFTADRCKVLELLAAQAAISIENARLYDTLESRVRSRTQELADRNQELSDAIARLKATQQRLVAQEKLASLGALTAGVAHELKNPLNFVNNFARLSAELATDLKRDLSAQFDRLGTDTSSELAETLGLLEANVTRIVEHGRRADGIINSMLLHARGTPSQQGPIDLNAMVAACMKLTEAARPNRGAAVDLQVEYDPEASMVEGREDDLRRVIINLLNNANDAVNTKSRAAGSGYHPQIRIATRRVGGRAEVSVHDNGVGISADILPKIYDPFFTTKGSGEGTGLGLSICHGIVEAHRGELEVRSVPGEFAEFIISLPGSIASKN